MAPVVGRIRRRSSFRALARPEGRGVTGPISVAFSAADGAAAMPLVAAAMPLVAYAIGRRAGGAVVRNRVRRQLRAIARQAAPGLAPGSYLVRVAPGAIGLPYDQLNRAFCAAADGAWRRAAAIRPAVQS